jgi:hypothetical protein
MTKNQIIDKTLELISIKKKEPFIHDHLGLYGIMHEDNIYKSRTELKSVLMRTETKTQLEDRLLYWEEQTLLNV